MAQSTLTPEDQDQDERNNVGQQIWDAETEIGGRGGSNSQKQSDDRTINDLEKQFGDDREIPYENTGKKGKAQSAAETARAAVAAGKAAAQIAENPVTAIMVVRKGGPIGLVVGIIVGILALYFGGLTLLPVHLYETILAKYDPSTTSYTIRSDRLIVNKLSNKATTASCSVTKVACRFSRPSNFMLEQLDSAGIQALDKDGKVIEKTKLGWPNERPASYQYTAGGNSTSPARKPIAATELKSALASDPNFRAAFHDGLKTRLEVFSDSVFKSFANKFGVTKKKTTTDDKTEKDVTNTVNDETSGDRSENASGEDVKVGTGGEDTPKVSATEDTIKANITEKFQGIFHKLAGSSAGDAVGLTAGAVCAVGDIPDIITSTARAYQMSQLVRFGALFMTMASSLKAGDANSQEVSSFTNQLTTVVNGKSAMDSYLMRYILYGDTSANGDTDYTKYVPGMAAGASLMAMTVILNSSAKKNICGVATSPITGLAISAAVAGATFGVGEIVNALLGVGISAALELSSTTLLPAMIKAIPPEVYLSLLKGAFGNVTVGAVGQSFGDLFGSAILQVMGQLGNAGANMPLSVADAKAYQKQTDAVGVAYAQEDQATKSPFDLTSNNTMMGSFFNKLIPLYSQMGSALSFTSSFGSLATSTVSSLVLGKSYAATNSDDAYTQCTDPSITNPADGDAVAADPACNIQYGIPSQYLNMDPQTVVNDLVNAGQIDDETGEAVPDAGAYQVGSAISSALGVPDGTAQTASYADWLSTCTDGTADQAVNCKINDPKTAEYAIYTIDHRIQKDMDNQDTAPGSNANISTDIEALSANIPNTCTNAKASGAGFTDISTLNGTTFAKKVNNAGANVAALNGSVYTFSDFTGTIGADISAGGIYGTSTAKTILEMTPDSSTKASQVPGTPSGAYDANNATTNQFYLLRFTNASPKLNCFTLKGTDQGHYYNGVMLSHATNAQISNIKLDNAGPGYKSSPPGETFAWNDFHGQNNIYKNIEIDGANEGAAGFGNNSTSGGTWIDSYVHDQKYSAAWTLWQQTNGAEFLRDTAANNHNAINLERVTGTVNVRQFTFDNNDHDFNIGNELSGDLTVNIYDPIIKSHGGKLIVNIGKIMDNKPNLDKRADVHVYVNGVDKTSELVTFTGGQQ